MDAWGIAGWAALIAVIAAFTAWALTELINRKWLSQWKAEICARGVEPGWWWTGIVATVAALIGAGAGALFAQAVAPAPMGSLLVGAIVGFPAGCAPAWIVRKVRDKASDMVTRAGDRVGSDDR